MTDVALETLREAVPDQQSPLPPIAPGLHVAPCVPDDGDQPAGAEASDAADPVLGFTCVIEYRDELRLITCRTIKQVGDLSYVGAICQLASGYRSFRCDRITAVIDPPTGEVLGDGAFFERFDRHFAPAPETWGLSRSRMATLNAGLNVLAFMARCDGHWHPLEREPIERFVCSLWLRREWEGDPPLDRILAHAQRLSPDTDAFFAGVEHYARSTTRSAILHRAVGDLIAADGVICASETLWAVELEQYLAGRARMAIDGDD